MRSIPGRRLAVLVFVALSALLAGRAARAAAAAGGKPSAAPPACRGVASQHFVFHDDPWIDLHHFLFQWARNVPERQPGDRRRAVEVPEAADLPSLGKKERAAWQSAVDSYRDHLIAGRLFIEDDLIGLRAKLADPACPGSGLADLDPALRGVLEGAMRVYRKHWWPAHHAADEAWIEERAKQLATYEGPLADRLAAAYGGSWPEERVRVDVAAYANWAGAYTTIQPARTTISSREFTGLDGLEILFHEVSHASFFELPLLDELAAAFRPYRIPPPLGLSHAIQFATPVELLRALLGDRLPPDHRFVGDRVGGRGFMARKYAAVVPAWGAFLAGRTTRAEALDRIARTLSGRPASPAGATGSPPRSPHP